MAAGAGASLIPAFGGAGAEEEVEVVSELLGEVLPGLAGSGEVGWAGPAGEEG